MGAPTLGDAEYILALAAAGHVYIYSGKDRDAVKARATEAKNAFDAATVDDAATHWIQPEHWDEALRRLQAEFGPARVHVMDPMWIHFVPPSGRTAFHLRLPTGEHLATVYHSGGGWQAFWPDCGHPAKGGWGSDLHRLFRYVEGFLDGPTDCATRCLTFDEER
jgi:hypothetical protein